jgi:hypothetical protein
MVKDPDPQTTRERQDEELEAPDFAPDVEPKS